MNKNKTFNKIFNIKKLIMEEKTRSQLNNIRENQMRKTNKWV